MRKLKVIINAWYKYGRLTVLKEEPYKYWKDWVVKRAFQCQCKCWNINIVSLGNLRRGHTKSCWCLQKEKLLKRIKTHWMTWTRIYNIWQWLKSRCDDKNYIRYKDYGWRWITYIKKWKKFESFYEDMQESYYIHFKKYWLDTSIERVNVDWNYCKENCIWLTNIKQCRNTRANINFNINWITKCLSEWCHIYKISHNKLYYRIKTCKMTITEALNYYNIEI